MRVGCSKDKIEFYRRPTKSLPRGVLGSQSIVARSSNSILEHNGYYMSPQFAGSVHRVRLFESVTLLQGSMAPTVVVNYHHEKQE